MRINDVTPIYTGGNIYVFVGKIDDNYFIASDMCYDIRIVDANPFDYTDTTYGNEEWCYEEWQAAHLIQDITDENEVKKTFCSILQWIIDNEPRTDRTNYSVTDIENDLIDIENYFA